MTEQQDFSTYKKPVLYEAQWWSQGLFIFTKSVTICTYFAAVSAAYTTCEKYVGISFSSLSYGLQILFHKSLRLYCKRRLVIFQELLSSTHWEKKQSLPLIQSKHSWYLDRHHFQNECRKDRQCIKRFVSHLIPEPKTSFWPWIPR